MSAQPLSAYARLLGIHLATDDAGNAICEMVPVESALGHPKALHGGATAGLIEQAGLLTVVAAVADPDASIKLASITVDYLRSGPVTPSRARGSIMRIGARVANVTVEAWSVDPSKPYAAARLTYLITR